MTQEGMNDHEWICQTMFETYILFWQTVKMSFDVDDSFIGGNRNAEGEDGGKSEPGKIGCDIVVASKLESASLIHTEGDYRGYLKKYTKK